MGLMDYLSITPAVAEQANKLTGVSAPPSSASNDKEALPNFEKAKPQESSPSTDVDYDKLIREKGYYGAFQSLNKKPDFEAEEKRTRRARELALLGDVANLGGQVFASGMGARRFSPIQSQVPQYTERLQRLRDAKRDYDVDFNNKSLSMIFRDYEQKRADGYRDKQLEAAARKDTYDRLWDKYKLDSELGYKRDKDKDAIAAKEEAIKETKRHNSATEAIGRTNAAANITRANKDSAKGNEVAYVTKYGDVTFNNPKNKRAATFSVLEIMRNGAPEIEREKIDKLLYEAQNGDMNSFNKAEMYVSQNLNSDPIALKHLYELAGKYGRVSANGNQKQLRDKTRGANNNKSLGLNW